MLDWEHTDHGRTHILKLDDDRLRITVTRHVDFVADEWVLVCHALNIPKLCLGRGELTVVKRAALRLVHGRLRQHLAACEKFFEEGRAPDGATGIRIATGAGE